MYDDGLVSCLARENLTKEAKVHTTHTQHFIGIHDLNNKTKLALRTGQTLKVLKKEVLKVCY